MGCHPSHWLIFFKMVIAPPTSWKFRGNPVLSIGWSFLSQFFGPKTGGLRHTILSYTPILIYLFDPLEPFDIPWLICSCFWRYITWFLGIAITMNWESCSKSTSISWDNIRLCLKRTRINWYDTDVYWPQPSGMRFLLVGFQHRRSSWRADDGGFRSARSTTCSARHDLSWRCKGHNFQEQFNERYPLVNIQKAIENCDLVRGFTHW